MAGQVACALFQPAELQEKTHTHTPQDISVSKCRGFTYSLFGARSTRNGAKTRHRPELSGLVLRGSEGRWRVFEGLKTLLASRIALSEHVGGPGVYEKCESGSFHGCQLNDCGFLEASDRASVHLCQPGNVKFLEASDGASIHGCQPGNFRFLEASDGASIHRCQPGKVRFLEASVGATLEPCDWIVTIPMLPVISTHELQAPFPGSSCKSKRRKRREVRS